MATQREIKRRIKSAKNIGQVTKALEMVSAVKMRKAQEAAASSRPYTEQLRQVLSELRTRGSSVSHPFLIRSDRVRKVLLLIVAPDRGLAGSLLTNLTRQVLRFVDQATLGKIVLDGRQMETGKEVEVNLAVWGRRGRGIAVKSGRQIVADFSESAHRSLAERIAAVSAFLTGEFLSGEYDLVAIAYSRFVNTMTQHPEVIQFLPVAALATSDSGTKLSGFTFEPSADQVLSAVLNRYVEQIANQIMLDSFAAEHSARMMAMQNAYENAADITRDLTLLYNKTRQAAITNEISDITSGSLL